ncbi:hypothetical protein IWX49DRAFT_50475 [Phyllosticta citricarpa]
MRLLLLAGKASRAKVFWSSRATPIINIFPDKDSKMSALLILPEDVQEFFGMSFQQFERLAEKLETIDGDERLVDMDELSVAHQLTIFLTFCQNQGSMKHASSALSVPRATVEQAFTNVCRALLALYPFYVTPAVPETRASAVPALKGDARFEFFGRALDKIVGAATIIDIGEPLDLTSITTNRGGVQGSSTPNLEASLPNPFLVGTHYYKGPQRCVLVTDVHGTFTSVYTPNYDNTARDRDIFAFAVTCGVPPPRSTHLDTTQHWTYYLAPCQDLPASRHLPLLLPFTDAEYPETRDAQRHLSALIDADQVTRKMHAIFNLRHAQLFGLLGAKPVREFCEAFPVLEGGTAGRAVSGGLLKALVVLWNFLREDEITGKGRARGKGMK